MHEIILKTWFISVLLCPVEELSKPKYVEAWYFSLDLSYYV